MPASPKVKLFMQPCGGGGAGKERANNGVGGGSMPVVPYTGVAGCCSWTAGHAGSASCLTWEAAAALKALSTTSVTRWLVSTLPPTTAASGEGDSSEPAARGGAGRRAAACKQTNQTIRHALERSLERTRGTGARQPPALCACLSVWPAAAAAALGGSPAGILTMMGAMQPWLRGMSRVTMQRSE